MEILNIIVASLSGLLLIYAGTTRLIKPIQSFCLKNYLDNPKIKLERRIDIFNEMRAGGGSSAFGGVILLLGTIISQLTLASFIVGIVIFLGNALGRLVNMKVDGKPNPQLIQGLIFELILGSANAFCLVNIWA